MYSVRRAIQADIQVDFFVPFTKMTILYSSNIWPLCLHLSLSELVTCLFEDFFWPNLNAGKVKQASGLVLITRVQNIMVPFFFHFLCFEGIVIRL